MPPHKGRQFEKRHTLKHNDTTSRKHHHYIIMHQLQKTYFKHFLCSVVAFYVTFKQCNTKTWTKSHFMCQVEILQIQEIKKCQAFDFNWGDSASYLGTCYFYSFTVIRIRWLSSFSRQCTTLINKIVIEFTVVHLNCT